MLSAAEFKSLSSTLRTLIYTTPDHRNAVERCLAALLRYADLRPENRDNCNHCGRDIVRLQLQRVGAICGACYYYRKRTGHLPSAAVMAARVS